VDKTLDKAVLTEITSTLRVLGDELFAWGNSPELGFAWTEICLHASAEDQDGWLARCWFTLDDDTKKEAELPSQISKQLETIWQLRDEVADAQSEAQWYGFKFFVYTKGNCKMQMIYA